MPPPVETRRKEYQREKSALAAVNGWRLMRVTGNQIKSGEAAQWIQAALGGTAE